MAGWLLTMVPWEILGVAAIVIAIAIAGFFIQSRWIADPILPLLLTR